MNKKMPVLLITLLCSSLPVIAFAGSFTGKTKSDYMEEIHRLMSSTKVFSPGSEEVREWGVCRDGCLSDRKSCYISGGDEYHCETIYDACTTACNARW